MGQFFSKIFYTFQDDKKGQYKSVSNKNTSNKKKEITINFIFQRHGTSCANIIKKTRFKKKSGITKILSVQRDINNYAPDPSLSILGVEQSLAVSDFFYKCDNENVKFITGTNITSEKIPIKKGGGDGEPKLIFCCSELIRSQQTAFLSFIRYMPKYLNEGKKIKKILIIPWLNETRSGVSQKDNLVISMDKTKEKWNEFIKALLNKNWNKLADDLGQEREKIATIIEKLKLKDNLSWDEIFEKPSEIYWNEIKSKFTKLGDKSFEPADTKQIFIHLKKILEDRKIEGEVNLVMVGHRKSLTKIISKLVPGSSDEKVEFNFKTNEIVNGEVIKLSNYKWDLAKESPTIEREQLDSLIGVRLFPIGFYKLLNNGICLPIKNSQLKISQLMPYYIFYISSLQIFMTFPFMISQKFGSCQNSKEIQKQNSKEIQKYPMFFDLTIEEYLKFLKNLKEIYENINNFFGKNTNYFYNYQEILKKFNIQERSFEQNKKITIGQKLCLTEQKSIEDLMAYYLFDFCGCNQFNDNSICKKVKVMDKISCSKSQTAGKKKKNKNYKKI